MSYQLGFFYVFAAVLIFSALKVVFSKNAVHSALFLMLAFSQAAALWLMLKAEFLGLTLVLVYLGAVMVLFLFVVMMLDVRVEGYQNSLIKNLAVAVPVGGLVSFELILVLWNGFDAVQVPLNASTLGGMSNTHQLGVLLYGQYAYAVQIAAVILLVAMVSAIALTMRGRKDTKTIQPSLQVHVRAKDRLKVVSMQPTMPKPTVADAEQAVN
jgi:NADH-quinone oxidoreductase subunit J